MRLKDHHGRKLNEIETNYIKETIEYRYLGLVLDGKGRIPLKKQKLELRSNYLRTKLKYYVQKLSFENQLLIW